MHFWLEARNETQVCTTRRIPGSSSISKIRLQIGELPPQLLNDFIGKMQNIERLEDGSSKVERAQF